MDKKQPEIPGIPYELKLGSIYIFEIKDWAMTREEAHLATNYYRDNYDIDIQFIFTSGSDFGLKAVPAIEADQEEGISNDQST